MKRVKNIFGYRYMTVYDCRLGRNIDLEIWCSSGIDGDFDYMVDGAHVSREQFQKAIDSYW